MNYREQNFSVKFFKLLANANRLKIIDLLAHKKIDLTVNDIAHALDLEATNTSNHLLKLKDSGILSAKQNSTKMYYTIKDKRIIEMLNFAKKLS